MRLKRALVLIIACLFFISPCNLLCQESQGSFYWQVYPNHTFSKVTKNDVKINAKTATSPLFGFGFGYTRKIAEQLKVDVSLRYHGTSYRYSSKQINNFEIAFVPMLGGNLCVHTKPNQKGNYLFLSLGTLLSYNSGFQTSFVIKDSINNTIASLNTDRKTAFNFFGTLALGAHFKREKRDISFGLQFNNGLRKTYKAVFTFEEFQNTTSAEIISKDTFLGVFCKFFFKKR